MPPASTRKLLAWIALGVVGLLILQAAAVLPRWQVSARPAREQGTHYVAARRLTDPQHRAYRLMAELQRDGEAWIVWKLKFPNGGWVNFKNDAAGGERLRPEKWAAVTDDRGEVWQIKLPADPLPSTAR